MSNNFFKQLKSTAKDEAIKAAKQAVREPLEILKDAKTNITGQPDVHQQGMSTMQEVMTNSGQTKVVSKEEESRMHSMAKSRLSQIENELRKLRQQREQISQQWQANQQELMKPQDQTDKKPLLIPTAPKKGPGGPGKSKKANMETAKQNKG